MGNLLLRTLMTICELGKEWADPFKIPVDEIAEEWRTQSSRGRYESAMWRAAGLEEPNGGGGRRGTGGGGRDASGGTGLTQEDCHMADVDATKNNGFFARWGETAPQRLGVLAGTHMRNGVQL